jgi:hypothetical protein
MAKKAAIVRIALGVLVLALVPTAFAAKGGNGPKSNTPAPTGNLSLVLLSSTDGQAHWGQQITFNVTTTATYPFVRVDCSQNGTLVYEQSEGFYSSWPVDMRNFTLKSAAWTGGAANCTALLYSTNWDGSNFQSLATVPFDVAA